VILSRSALLARLIAAADILHDDDLAVLTWIAERAAQGLSVAGLRDRKGGGFDVRNMTSMAATRTRAAWGAVSSLLGYQPAIKGMPIKEVR
jgi:hypothetical protein